MRRESHGIRPRSSTWRVAFDWLCNRRDGDPDCDPGSDCDPVNRKKARRKQALLDLLKSDRQVWRSRVAVCSTPTIELREDLRSRRRESPQARQASARERECAKLRGDPSQFRRPVERARRSNRAEHQPMLLPTNSRRRPRFLIRILDDAQYGEARKPTAAKFT